jgi:hypothetical protein
MYEKIGPFVRTDDTPGQRTAISDVLCDTGDIAFNGGARFFMELKASLKIYSQSRCLTLQ